MKIVSIISWILIVIFIGMFNNNVATLLYWGSSNVEHSLSRVFIIVICLSVLSMISFIYGLITIFSKRSKTKSYNDKFKDIVFYCFPFIILIIILVYWLGG